MFDFRTAVGITKWKSIYVQLISNCLKICKSELPFKYECKLQCFELKKLCGRRNKHTVSLTPPIAEPLCSRFTLAGLCLDLISCPGGSNRAALPGPTLHPRELRFLSHHNNSLSICWSGAPNFVVLTAAGLTPDFLHSCPPSSPLEGMIAFTAEVDGRGGLYLPSAHPPPPTHCPNPLFSTLKFYFGGSALYWHSLSHFLCVSLLGSLSGSTKPRSVLQSGTGPLIDYSCSVSCTFDMMGLLDG